MSRQISEERKATYYIGIGLTVLGGILFASGFLTFMAHFGDFSNFQDNAKTVGFLWLGGMALLIVGSIIRGIGSRGLAGSGVVLDPEKARDDLEPGRAPRLDRRHSAWPAAWPKMPSTRRESRSAGNSRNRSSWSSAKRAAS